jgi:hypothetical protein
VYLVFDLSFSRQKTVHRPTLVNQVLFDYTVNAYLCTTKSPCIRWAHVDLTVSDGKIMDSAL